MSRILESSIFKTVLKYLNNSNNTAAANTGRLICMMALIVLIPEKKETMIRMTVKIIFLSGFLKRMKSKPKERNPRTKYAV